MLNREQKQALYKDLYKDGICTCKAAGRFRWVTIQGMQFYMCIKCNRPKYWTSHPPVSE